MKKIMKKRYFPCPYCKGKGIAEQGEFVDGQQVSPDTYCGYCESKGLIEIGGKIHMEHKAFNIGCDIIWQPNRTPKQDAYSYNYIVRIGKKALKLV